MGTWSRSARVSPSMKKDVCEEARRLLSGGSLAAYGRQRGAPPWVALNVVAHADLAVLKQLTANCSGRHPASWEAAAAYLASETMSVTATEKDLREVQRDVLIPLELELLSGSRRSPATPLELTTLVMGAITDHRVRRYG